MRLSLSSDSLVAYVARQVDFTFPDDVIPKTPLKNFIPKVLDRVEYCFSHVNVKHYSSAGEVIFNHLHSGQYAIFLYYLANTIWRLNGDESLATKIYYLNKSLHAVDIFYQVDLPDIFFMEHPLGTVLGRAKYANYFVAYQRCTVGGNLDLQYPTLDEGIVLFGGSAVIGNCHLGANCWVQSSALIMDKDIPGDRVVFGRHPHVGCKPATKNVKEHFFR